MGKSVANAGGKGARTPIRVEPADRWGWRSVTELWQYRELFLILAGRDIKVRYKQTLLGVAWVLLQPLLATAIFTVVFGFFVRIPSGDTPYVLLVLCGLLPWNYFSNAVQRSGSSLFVDARLVSKVYFPRLLIPFASIGSSLVDFGVTLLVLIAMLIFYGTPLTWRLLFVPLIVLLVTFAAAGLGLWFAALSVRYRDIRNLLPFILQVGLYATPVVYSLDTVPERWRDLYSLNPAVGFVEGFRWAVLGANTLNGASVLLTVTATLLLFASGLLVFRRMEQSFDDTL